MELKEAWQKIEKHFRIKDIAPVKKIEYRGFDVYLCEGGPYFDRRKAEYPLGWYESAYALGQGDKVLFYQPLEFEILHDIKTLSDSSRKEGRVNSAIEAAKRHIDTYHETLNGQKIH